MALAWALMRSSMVRGTKPTSLVLEESTQSSSAHQPLHNSVLRLRLMGFLVFGIHLPMLFPSAASSYTYVYVSQAAVVCWVHNWG